MLIICLSGFSCNRANNSPSQQAPEPTIDETSISQKSFERKDIVTNDKSEPSQYDVDDQSRTAVLAGGCFWCTEGVFQHLNGVTDVESGYAGGDAATANYKAVTTGRTKHAEAIKITYNPNIITYGQLLKVFFTVAHDPTTLNRQGNDIGPQYRSAIFYENPEQKDIAESYIKQLSESRYYSRDIVTTLEPLDHFYPAENYHQDYVDNNPNQPYIRYQALPKINKLKTEFPNQLKNNN